MQQKQGFEFFIKASNLTDQKRKVVMKILFYFVVVFLLPSLGFAQSKFFTKDGSVTFFSSTPVEDIKAINRKASSVLDIETGNLEWAVLIKAFVFEKALMQEHFNENYMESDKFPKSSFKGKIIDFDPTAFKNDGSFTKKVKGTLTIKGVSKEVETEAFFRISSGLIKAESIFNIAVADFGIKVPSVVRDNIAKVLEVTVKSDYQELKR